MRIFLPELHPDDPELLLLLLPHPDDPDIIPTIQKQRMNIYYPELVWCKYSKCVVMFIISQAKYGISSVHHSR